MLCPLVLGRVDSVDVGEAEAEFKLTASFAVDVLGTVREEDTVRLDEKLEEDEASTAKLGVAMLSFPFALDEDAVVMAVDLNEEMVRKGGGPSPLPMVDDDVLDDAAEVVLVEIGVGPGCE